MARPYPVKLLIGKKPPRARAVGLDELLGKTIVGVGSSEVEGPNGNEPSTVLYFDDGTGHEFVHPREED